MGVDSWQGGDPGRHKERVHPQVRSALVAAPFGLRRPPGRHQLLDSRFCLAGQNSGGRPRPSHLHDHQRSTRPQRPVRRKALGLRLPTLRWERTHFGRKVADTPKHDGVAAPIERRVEFAETSPRVGTHGLAGLVVRRPLVPIGTRAQAAVTVMRPLPRRGNQQATIPPRRQTRPVSRTDLNNVSGSKLIRLCKIWSLRLSDLHLRRMG